MVLVIDGKRGGGQILRTALGLSALTLRPVKILNIRGARSNGGLKPQHLEGVLALAKLCDAKVIGAHLGSSSLEFYPRSLESRSLQIHIPTAGSIGLLFQCLQLPAAFGKSPLDLQITGGSTASAWAPPLHYTQKIFLGVVSKMGYSAEIRILREGFYPKGGAHVEIHVDPVRVLDPLKLESRGKLVRIGGISICGNLPSHVAHRQARSASEVLIQHGFPEPEIECIATSSSCPGSSITLWAEFTNTILGSDALGERGVPAEKVGEKAAHDLLKLLESQVTLDEWMGDQILPFMALARGESYAIIPSITSHVETNLETLSKFFDLEYQVKGEAPAEIQIHGIGFKNRYRE